MSSLQPKYNPQDIEDKWYQTWEEEGYMRSQPDDREAYSIVIPPPNVTGVLHMGHMLNNTVQDVLARRARHDGKNVSWVPGTDHASIATEAKVVGWLREKGIKKSDLTREEFMKYAWEWTDKYGGIILKQLRKLGASCDWDRTSFTMDEVRSKQVIQAFIDLYEKGRLYRDLRMVNWDPQAQTVLSNEEVIYSEENSKLYVVKYKVEGSDEIVLVATTRPETILGDTAVAVNPKDERYSHLKGAKLIVPIVGRAVPVIFDDYVDMEFGTGALKVTPAHDVNDYELGKKYDLQVVDIFNPDGSLNEKAQYFVGMDRFDARTAVVEKLKELDLLEREEDYVNNVGRSERTQAVVEPRLSLQWFVDMPELAKPALDAVMSDELKFYPRNMKNTYRHWMENIRDWCISRQLWWGHRIPAYYYNGEVAVADSAEKALKQLQAKFPQDTITLEDIKQDEDVLDTWFSSWLWPFSVYDSMQSGGDADYYYPTAVLVTGWDIIFLWVARMVMAGYEWKGEMPFKDVYFTGMVRDKQRRKMSKSLGNSPDALKLIEDFGADGVRFGLLSSSPAGGDILFDEKLCEQGRNFSNKMWNALRLIDHWQENTDINRQIQEHEQLAINWIEGRIAEVQIKIEQNYREYRLSEALMELYRLVWDDFCSWFLEMVKPPYGEKISATVLDSAKTIYKELLTLLHPFMPFVTEEIFSVIRTDDDAQHLMDARLNALTGGLDNKILDGVSAIQALTSKVRESRNKQGLSPKEPLVLFLEKNEESTKLTSIKGATGLFRKMANLSEIAITDSPPEQPSVTLVSGTIKAFLILPEMDIEAEIKKLEDELKYAQGFVKKIKGKLSNEKFVNNAPPQVVQNEQKKLKDGEERVKMIQESLASYSN